MSPDTEDIKKWLKSTYSAENGCCVEVHFSTDGVLVRDSKQVRSDLASCSILSFTTEEWAAFTNGVKAGEFDGPSES